MSDEGISVISQPPITIRPCVGRSSAISNLTSVVFPVPDCPTMEINSLVAIERLTFFTPTVSVSYIFVTLRNSIIQFLKAGNGNPEVSAYGGTTGQVEQAGYRNRTGALSLGRICTTTIRIPHKEGRACPVLARSA